MHLKQTLMPDEQRALNHALLEFVEQDNADDNLLAITGLLNKGADIQTHTPELNTVLHIACLHGRHRVAALLLKRDADLQAVNAQGETPLHLACQLGYDKTVQVLLKAGAVIDARNHQQQTPLFKACHFEQVATVKLLLAHQANPLLMDNQGHSPWSLAQHRQHVALMKLLNQAVKISTPSQQPPVNTQQAVHITMPPIQQVTDKASRVWLLPMVNSAWRWVQQHQQSLWLLLGVVLLVAIPVLSFMGTSLLTDTAIASSVVGAQLVIGLCGALAIAGYGLWRRYPQPSSEVTLPLSPQHSPSSSVIIQQQLQQQTETLSFKQSPSRESTVTKYPYYAAIASYPQQSLARDEQQTVSYQRSVEHFGDNIDAEDARQSSCCGL